MAAASEQSARLASATAGLFEAQTVRPEESYCGRLQVLLPKAKRGENVAMFVSIKAGEDTRDVVLFVDGPATAQQRRLF